MKTRLITFLILFLSFGFVKAERLLVEAENFNHKGGWVVDQQFMDLMGSPYLMAHGLGKPVSDAMTQVVFPGKGTYYVYVRTYNWTSPWKKGEGPGKFRLSVNKKMLPTVLGVEGETWIWQSAGKVNINNTEITLGLHDLTGFNGRCDALYFTTEEDDVPPFAVNELSVFRRELLHFPATPPSAGTYDLVVVGAGVAGISAAVSAARLGCKVALIHDRPVLGGNNSSEIRVHLGGRIEAGAYKELGNLQKEFGPIRGGNAQPGDFYEDEKKYQIVANEENITLFANFRAIAVEMDADKIKSVTAKHIESGDEKKFTAPLFSDCTGDGTVGYLAGADFAVGRESKAEFGEETAPDVADKMTMGSSVQWYSVDEKKSIGFPYFNYGVRFTAASCEKVTMGEWTWETGMNYDQINDFERIRDYGLMVVFSNWSYLKNELKENDLYKNRKLGWVAYVAGKRESRRLLGDYILKEDDLKKYVVHEDGTAATTWTIDLHYPDPKNTANFPGEEFKSIAKHKPIYPYPIPYRCLYSRNVDNLFMAGRNISVTHVALGTVRVMRTTGMMGEVVGMAASLCKKYKETPRGIYRRHLSDLKDLMKSGVGKKGLPNNQKYNEGETLKSLPIIR
ncbi:MAG: FAD-dependent oxidoreductase [Massilibacteroides sp.]|nr:FAD-dependent oxidoreductase [Massilibacteroides sp.]MDD3063124.1 FAD-dependent oxidoreductase [Massilibacteroides sp.]MDD4114660.1 FAD-dependent oxidoreductase [Massilibacteroides sp.]MDD4660818.1 FAD-dependent oxidoreductase [Massilibacteroides sp.]